MAGRLTVAKIEGLRPKAARYRVGDAAVPGLVLEVMASGSKVWRLRVHKDGKPAVETLGKYINAAPAGEDANDNLMRMGQALTLDEARAKATDMRQRTDTGQGPAAGELEAAMDEARDAYDAARKNTFAAVAQRFQKDHEQTWSDSRINVVDSFIRNHCADINGEPVTGVTPKMLKDLLRKVEKDSPAVAKEGRGILKQVFQSAFLDDIIPANPAADLSGVLKRRRPKSHTPLPLALVPKFWEKMAELRGNNGQPLPAATVAAMKLLAILAVRGNELRQAEWSWIDAGVLRFPASVMKMPSPHLVPLSRQAVAILEELKAESDDNKFIFPHSQNFEECMAEDHLYMMARRVVEKLPAGTDFTAHGWRATFSTLAREHSLGSGAAIELALAHQRRGVAGRYDFSELVPERRELLQKWADMVLPAA